MRGRNNVQRQPCKVPGLPSLLASRRLGDLIIAVRVPSCGGRPTAQVPSQPHSEISFRSARVTRMARVEMLFQTYTHSPAATPHTLPPPRVLYYSKSERARKKTRTLPPHPHTHPRPPHGCVIIAYEARQRERSRRRSIVASHAQERCRRTTGGGVSIHHLQPPTAQGPRYASPFGATGHLITVPYRRLDSRTHAMRLLSF